MEPSTAQLTRKRRVRRSKRLGLSVPVLVHGKDISSAPFRELTRTITVNANGALIALSALVEEHQTLLIENTNTRLEQECRVVHVGPSENGKWKVGIEFTHMAGGFWEIYFPPPMSARSSAARQ
jgi:PilZ domain